MVTITSSSWTRNSWTSNTLRGKACRGKTWFFFHLFIYLLFSVSLYGAAFTATVKRNQIGPAQPISLSLKLSDAQPQALPNFEPLNKDFTLHSQQQYSSTVINNGQMSQSTTWELILFPKKTATTQTQIQTLTLPSLSVKTNQGTLSSDAISIQVDPSFSSTQQAATSKPQVTLTSDISNARPFKYEPFVYTAKLVTPYNMANVRINKLEVENAVIEQLKEPQVEDKIVEGERYKLLTLSYLVTPLQPGTLTLPSLNIQGDLILPSQTSRRSLFDFDFNADPFQLMQNPFSRQEPFNQSTQPISIDIQPPVEGVTPWLPADKITLEQTSQLPTLIKAGEPFTLGFKIEAEGLRATQLPNLEETLTKIQGFKVYADKAQLQDSVKGDTLHSSRTQEFTFIPQKSGQLQLPLIRIVYWALQQKAKAEVSLPAQKLRVLPEVIKAEQTRQSEPQEREVQAKKNPDTDKNVEATEEKEQPNGFQLALSDALLPFQNNTTSASSPLIWLIAALVALLVLLLVLFVVMLLFYVKLAKKVVSLTRQKEPLRSEVESHHTLKRPAKEVGQQQTPQQILQSLQEQAHQRWQISLNAPLSTVSKAIQQHTPPSLHEELHQLTLQLEALLYGDGSNANPQQIAKRFSSIMAKSFKNATHKEQKQAELLPPLNPS